jgi:amino acid permease
MSYFKPLRKSKSFPVKLFFVLSLVFAGPVSFLLYDFYVDWSQNGHQTIAWYLAFAYDAFGAWGGVLIAMSGAVVCYTISYMLYRKKRMYSWGQ